MTEAEKLKQVVKDQYAKIALSDAPQPGCCGTGQSEVYNIMNDDYSSLEGYNEDADLSLGCGLPTQFAKIQKGNIVIDLGSGAGNDCFVARAETGETGKVIGIDFTPEMIEKARKNADKLGFNNVEFRQGDIENMPVTENSADVVVSNCVLNLVPDKAAVFKEIIRVLKPGAHFSISDVVLKGNLPDKVKNAAEMYAGCVSGALQKMEYVYHIVEAGFANITIQKEKEIVLPDDILSNYLTEKEIQEYRASGCAIKSITVYAEKPQDCCSTEPTCC